MILKKKFLKIIDFRKFVIIFMIKKIKIFHNILKLISYFIQLNEKILLIYS
jgi:hypothetical protein